MPVMPIVLHARAAPGRWATLRRTIGRQLHRLAWRIADYDDVWVVQIEGPRGASQELIVGPYHRASKRARTTNGRVIGTRLGMSLD